ncbi:LysR substrate-binding domain-containing protein [Sinomonas sp. P47F7]|uniref:LysR substrate-binding domain-containing protein n=1 Tax=Sinomonas sp. P47F7 TaxID=3410987 RepID=UPI003BF5FD47
MELEQVRVFLAVAEELHFGRAAERLHMAQPPVSRIVRRLEHDLRAELFVRSTRNVRLTEEGRALIGPARDMLETARRAEFAVRAASRGEVGQVRVAYAGASTHVLIGVLAREVRSRYPGIDFGLYSQNFALPALGKVLRGEVEISLGRWDFVPGGVRTRVIAEEDLMLAVPTSHRLASLSEVRMADLAGEPFVALPPHEGSVLGDRLRRLSLEAGFEAEIVQVVPDSWTAMALVGAEVGCSLTLSSVAANVSDPNVRFLKVLDPTLPVQLRMAWVDDDNNMALRAVLWLAESVWPSL